MQLTITFTEAPSVTEFCAILDGVAKAYPYAALAEPTNDLTVVIQTNAPSPTPST